MVINLAPELEEIIRSKIVRGEYDSADALVEEAVKRLVEEEQEEDACRDEIRARIEAAQAEINRGEFAEYDENTIHNLAGEVDQRGLKKLAAEREKSGIGG